VKFVGPANSARDPRVWWKGAEKSNIYGYCSWTVKFVPLKRVLQ